MVVQVGRWQQLWLFEFVQQEDQLPQKLCCSGTSKMLMWHGWMGPPCPPSWKKSLPEAPLWTGDPELFFLWWRSNFLAVGLGLARIGRSDTPAVAIHLFFARLSSTTCFSDNDYLAETLPKVVWESGIEERVHGGVWVLEAVGDEDGGDQGAALRTAWWLEDHIHLVNIYVGTFLKIQYTCKSNRIYFTETFAGF